MKLDNDTREISAFRNWDELVAATAKGYIPTIPPESPAHKRVRRALARRGVRIYPPALVKLTKLTSAQAWLFEEFFTRLEDTDDRLTRQLLKGSNLTNTTVTMTQDLALEMVENLWSERDEAMERAAHCADNSYHTVHQGEFASRSVGISYDTLTKKIEKAIKGDLR
jgi:hypothetical protein